MTKRRLFLHLGVHRTGTSSIQHAMQSNFGQLLWKGVFHAYAVGRHKSLFDDLFSGKTTALEIAQDITARADHKPCHIHSISLSDEDICTHRDLAPLAGLSAYFEVHPVFFIRRQDLWLESWYRQHVKWQWDKRYAKLTFDQFLARRREFFWVDYDSMASRLGRIFGSENLRIIPFEDGQRTRNSVSQYFDTLGVSDVLSDIPQINKNRSFSPRMTEFMRSLPLAHLPIDQRHRIERACAQADAALPARASFFANRAQRDGILGHYAASNRRLAKAYFGRETLFQTDGAEPTAEHFQGQPESPNQALIQDIVAPILTLLAQAAAPPKTQPMRQTGSAEQVA